MKLSRGAVFLVTAVVACSAWLIYYQTGTFERDADLLMQREVTRGHFSGTVLISRGNQVLFTKGYGLANADWKVPNAPDTKFEIGSITKTFTATLILQLEQQRKLALTDAICTYIEACPSTWSPVTLHHLLSHTSGIYNFTLAPDFDREQVVPQTREEILARVRAHPLAFAPGERFEYSNTNFFLLAMVIEKITGQSYERALKERILEPLGMNDTGLIHRDAVLSRHATSYHPTRSGLLEVATETDESWTFGAGSMYSTVGDLRKWSEGLDSDRILPRATLARMWQPVKGGYGYGWELPANSLPDGNRQIIQHTGLIAGFATVFQRFLDEHLTVIVLANSLAGQPRRVAQSLSALALGEHYVASFDRDTVELSAGTLQRFAGDYELGEEIYTLTVRDGHLFVHRPSHPEEPELELLAVSDTQFFLRDNDSELVATHDSQGRVTGFVFGQGAQSRVVRKIR